MNFRIISAISLLSLLLLVLSCSAQGVPTKAIAPAGQSGLSSVSSAGKPGWQQEWEKTLQAAQKEGKVVIMNTAGGTVGNSLAKTFYDKYGITAEFITQPGGTGATKIITEQKAGLFVSDLYMGGNTNIL